MSRKTNAAEKEAKPKLPMTVAQAAKLWGMHPSRVKQLVDQNRVKHERVGGGDTRAHAILIHQLNRPDRLAPGALAELKKTKKDE